MRLILRRFNPFSYRGQLCCGRVYTSMQSILRRCRYKCVKCKVLYLKLEIELHTGIFNVDVVALSIHRLRIFQFSGFGQRKVHFKFTVSTLFIGRCDPSSNLNFVIFFSRLLASKLSHVIHKFDIFEVNVTFRTTL